MDQQLPGGNNQFNENQYNQNQYNQNENMQNQNLKFCKFCGEKIPMDAVICVKCGRQVEEIKSQNPYSQGQPQVIITNDNSSRSNSYANANMGNPYMYGKMPKNKGTALILCLLLGVFGAHKFYEGKAVMGIIYLLTGGFCFLGVFIDFLALLAKPPVYYV